MNLPNCDNHCDQGNCPFMTDPFNAYRQVCVKCGQDYFFRKHRFDTFLLLGALIACILLLTNNHVQTIESQPKTQPLPQSLQSGS